MTAVEPAETSARYDPENSLMVHEEDRDQIVHQALLTRVSAQATIFVTSQSAPRPDPQSAVVARAEGGDGV